MQKNKFYYEKIVYVKHYGIILKVDIYKSKTIIIFDNKFGKIECKLNFFKNNIRDFYIGSILSYALKNNSQYYSISDIEILDLALYPAKIDILFLHHVIEICYYFSLPEVPEKFAFELLKLIYFNQKILNNNCYKKIYIFKLLIIFGCQLDLSQILILELKYLSNCSINSLFNVNINLELEKKLDECLYNFVYAHPDLKHFKTLYFLEKSRIL